MTLLEYSAICTASHSKTSAIKGMVNASTYSSKSEVSTMNTLKPKYRSPLSDKYLNDCVRAVITKYCKLLITIS
jgi:hypothetical protein